MPASDVVIALVERFHQHLATCKQIAATERQRDRLMGEPHGLMAVEIRNADFQCSQGRARRGER